MEWIVNKDEIVEAGNAMLEQYLSFRGLQSDKYGKYLCINPDHHDTEPSMKLYGDRLYCFGCGQSFDIVDVVRYMDGVDMREAIERIAKFVNVIPIYEKDEALLSMYDELSKCLTYNPKYWSDEVREYVEKKKLNWHRFEEFGVGVFDMNKFRKVISKYDDTKVTTLGLRNVIASPKSLTFTIRNPEGIPVAFAARNCSGSGVKYTNTKTTIYYHKAKNPYMIDRVQGKDIVYIVEGYTDALAMQMNGMKAIAIASAKIPVDTIKTLKESGTDGIVVVLDGDKEGIKGMVKTIENVLTREKIKCALKKLPDGVDPDEYMRDNGKRALYQLEAYSFSRFWLENTDYEPMEALNKILKIMSKCEVGDLNLHAKEISNYMKSKEHDYKPEDIIKLYKSTVVEERFPNIVDSMQGIEHQLSELRTALKDVMDRIYG